MEFIGSIIGLVIGGAIFMALLSFIPSMKDHLVVAVIVFLLCWGLGIWITAIALYAAIIIGVVALIAGLIKKRKSIEMPDELDMDTSEADGLNTEESNSLDMDMDAEETEKRENGEEAVGGEN